MIVPSVVLSVILLGAAAAAAAAEPTMMKPEQTWQGSAKDEEKAKTVPKLITGAEKLAEAWKACERTDAVPEVDFKKHLVVILTTRGSRVNPRVTLGPEGDLRLLGIETRDFRPGFRYVISVFPREGVKTVNGEPLR
jgi:hypothetical protein